MLSKENEWRIGLIQEHYIGFTFMNVSFPFFASSKLKIICYRVNNWKSVLLAKQDKASIEKVKTLRSHLSF